MKPVVVFAFLVADICALTIPEGNTTHTEFAIDLTDERSISGSVKKAVDGLKKDIVHAGLDPLHIHRVHFSKVLPVPVLFSVEAYATDIRSDGLSNIVVHKVTYNLITSRLNFDFELPLINFSVGAASTEVTLFGRKLDIKASGKVGIHSIRVVGQVRLHIHLPGVSVRNVKINFTLGGIKSDVKLVVQGQDYSNKVNHFIQETVPKAIKDYSSDINELLEIILKDLIEAKM